MYDYYLGGCHNFAADRAAAEEVLKISRTPASPRRATARSCAGSCAGRPSRALLPTDGRTVVLQGDLRRPGELLADPALRATIDLSEPVAVLLLAVLHFVPDADDPYAAVAKLRDATVPGSVLALSHLTLDGLPTLPTEQGTAIYRRSSSPLVPRSRDEVARFLDGYELVDPGLVKVADWRPDGEPQAAVSHGYGGVGVRR